MKKLFTSALFLLSLSTQILHANYNFIFTPNSSLTNEQWQRYQDGAIVAYQRSMGKEMVREMFPKVRAAGRDIMEMTKEDNYFGHVCLVEKKLENETIYRLGMFGLAKENDFPEFSQAMMAALISKYPGHDFSAGCPDSALSTLGQLIESLGFKPDSSVAEDPAVMKAFYGINTSIGYTWYRFSTKK